MNNEVAGPAGPKVDQLLRLKQVRREGTEALVPVAETDGWPADLSLESLPKSVKRALRIDLDRAMEDDEPADCAVAYVIVRLLKAQTATTIPEWPALDGHLDGLRKCADADCAGLEVAPKLAEAVSLAAEYPDL